MSDDLVERKPLSVVAEVVEEAIEKIYNILLLNDPDTRQRVAGLIRSYIEAKYFPSAPQSFPDPRGGPDWLNGMVIPGAVEVMEAVKRGDIDPTIIRRTVDDFIRDMFGVKFTTPAARMALEKRAAVFLYKEYCGKRGFSKAEFVRHIIKMNETVPKAQQRGIRSTNYKNVYRELSRLLQKERGKAD
jgi:hypothetical protein